MNRTILNKIYEYLEVEAKTKKIGKIPSDIYQDVSHHIRKIRNNAVSHNKSIVNNLSNKERELLIELTTRLLQIRIEKASFNDGVSSDNLLPEEKYVVRPFYLSSKRLGKIISTISNGQISMLKNISEEIISSFTMVRFEQPHPAFIGIDLKKYGPFEFPLKMQKH
jgi:DNA replication initiation complex subunit (GINS family)